MSKREQITLLIEEYIGKFLVDDETVLSVADIRKWPAVDSLCENHDSANICKAMQAVKYGKCYAGGEENSSSFKMFFTRKFQNVKTEDISSENEMQENVQLTDWEYALRVRQYAHIHYWKCGQLWKKHKVKQDNAIISVYPTYEIANTNAEKTLKKIRTCPFCLNNKNITEI